MVVLPKAGAKKQNLRHKKGHTDVAFVLENSVERLLLKQLNQSLCRCIKRMCLLTRQHLINRC